MQALIRGLMAAVFGVWLISVNAVGTATQQPADPPEKTPRGVAASAAAPATGRTTPPAGRRHGLRSRRSLCLYHVPRPNHFPHLLGHWILP